MSDSPPAERNSNSKSNLIEVQHVGVTAKLQSPLKGLLLNYSSSTETDNNQPLYRGSHHGNTTKYNKFTNDVAVETDTTVTDTTVTDNSRILYEMKSSVANHRPKGKLSLTPSKIEFQLYTKSSKRLQKSKSSSKPKKKAKRKLFVAESKTKQNVSFKETPNIFQRLRQSFGQMKVSNVSQSQPPVDKIFEDLPEPEPNAFKQEIRIGIYPFDHGCAEYLKTHDCPPYIHSLALADKATEYATKFWAEFFGSLHIGVAFVVTFLLQSYRFILYSLVNTLMVGVLHMTSDYFIKPLLTVIFNGFLQPPLIFCFNILSSIRDILAPIADALNHFMKPVATVGRSVRLVHATYNKKNITKNV